MHHLLKQNKTVHSAHKICDFCMALTIKGDLSLSIIPFFFVEET
jgi:hypothetical protein